jgi:hypothetical protein
MSRGSASDYITAKKQNAIYTSIKVNAQITGVTVNPVKPNGYYYNNFLNVNVPRPCSFNGCAGGILTNARSYQLRLDFKRGKYYNNYVCNCQNKPIKKIFFKEFCEIIELPSNEVVDCLCSTCAFN